MSKLEQTKNSNQSEKPSSDIKKSKVENLYPKKESPKKKLKPEERTFDNANNLAKQKKTLAENAGKDSKLNKQEHILDEKYLELQDMSRKERRKYNWQKEKEKLSELTFWRKIQYLIMYYGLKFVAVLAGIGLIVLIIFRIYVASCPVALDIVTVNDVSNEVFESKVIELYSSYYEVPENARFMVDTGLVIHPEETYTSADMSHYTKMYSSLTSDSTQVVICDSDVLEFYAIDGYILELQHALPEDLYEYFKDRLYECDGPVEDSDYYAIDLTGTKFAELTCLGQEQPLLCMPGSLSDENREVFYNFLRMIMELEEE